MRRPEAASVGSSAGGAARTSEGAIAIAVAIAANIVSHWQRTAPAVVAPDILRDMGLSSALLAAVTSVFFFAAAASQIPAGVLYDRLGLSRTIPALLAIGALGAFVFALSTGAPGLLLGRALSGVGCGVVIMGSVVLCARLCPPEKFPVVMGMMLATGQLGNILSTAPTAYLADAIGWRGTFGAMAAATLVLAAFYLFILRNRRDAGGASGEPMGRAFLASWGIATDRRLWPIFAMAFVAYSAAFSLLGLWGGIYLEAVMGLGVVARGNVLLIGSASFAAGLYFFGWLHRWSGSAKTAIAFGAVMTMFCYAGIALVPDPGTAGATVFIALASFFGAFCGSIITHGRLFYASDQIGRGVTVMNTMVLAGAMAAQAWSAVLMAGAEALFPGEAATPFRILFGALALWIGLGLWAYRRARAAPEPAAPATTEI